jgi:hypothetical protein
VSVIEEIEFNGLTRPSDIEGLRQGRLQFEDYAGLVSKRAFTGEGFNTEFKQDHRLAGRGDGEPCAIGNVAGLLNENVEVGFMVKSSMTGLYGSKALHTAMPGGAR